MTTFELCFMAAAGLTTATMIAPMGLKASIEEDNIWKGVAAALVSIGGYTALAFAFAHLINPSA